MTDAQILALLEAPKVYQGGAWVALDEDGAPLADPDGILTRGLLGALLYWPRERADIYGSGDRRRPREDDDTLRRLVQDKWEAIELARTPPPAPATSPAPARQPVAAPAAPAAPHQAAASAISLATSLAQAAQAQDRLAQARRLARDEEALVLLLAELA